MKCRIIKPADSGVVQAPPSKSAAHRMLIAAGLSGIDIENFCKDVSQDMDATRDCIKGILSDAKVKQVSCGESGSTLRFMLPIAGALGANTQFRAAGRLPNRPLGALREALESHGCTMSKEGNNPICISGQLKSGEYTLPGDISSQYVTGLLMALPLVKKDSHITIVGKLQSKPYVDLTMDTLTKAGIKIVEKPYGYMVPGGQKYNLPVKYVESIEGDWSNGAFWLVMKAIRSMGIECEGLDLASAQGDKAIVDIISGASQKGELIVDASDIPDLIPVVSVLASARRKGLITRVINGERLRYKESDRLKAVARVMNGLGADIEELEDGLIIKGVEKLKGGEADGCNDHRIVMMAATAACISENPITIDGYEAVAKSYPNFFDEYQKLGGEIEWL